MILSRRVDDLILPATVTRIVALGDPHGDLAGLEVVLGGEERAGTAILSVGDNIGYADANACSELCRRLATRGIPSVFGNHEDWSSDDGELFLMKKPGGTKVLAADALAFCRARPMRIRITLEKEPGLVVSVVHTLAREVDGRIGWEYVTPVNADVLADEEGAQVVLCGHSHGPAIYEISPDGQVHTTHLSLEGDETASVTLRQDWRYVIDCGSLARTGYHNEPGTFALATYGFVDLTERTVGMRAVAKAGESA